MEALERILILCSTAIVFVMCIGISYLREIRDYLKIFVNATQKEYRRGNEWKDDYEDFA